MTLEQRLDLLEQFIISTHQDELNCVRNLDAIEVWRVQSEIAEQAKNRDEIIKAVKLLSSAGFEIDERLDKITNPVRHDRPAYHDALTKQFSKDKE